MANYETANELKSYVNNKVKEINKLIQELPSISEVVDVIDDISDVGKFLSGLSGNSNNKVQKDIDTTVSNLSETLSNIKTYVKDLKGVEFTVSYESVTTTPPLDSELLVSKENLYSIKNTFLEKNFPKISD